METEGKGIALLDEGAMVRARQRLDSLTKPRGSLGRLEEVVVQLAGITGQETPVVEPALVVVAAADHGVTREGVSLYDDVVTAEMVRNFLAGGAAISVLARTFGLRLVVVDAGLRTALAAPELLDASVRRGSGDILHEPAMTEAETRALLARGRALVAEEVKRGARLLIPGEMGIGNSTAAAAVTARLLRLPAEATVGRGTGLDDQGLARKRAVVAAALRRSTAPADDALAVLADLGGLEMAFLAGAILGAAGDRLPVLLDGFISSCAALVAARLEPQLTPFLLAAHVSAEPGHSHVLTALGLEPLLQLNMRLGEGSGAAVAYPLLLAATRLQAEMATFASASVTDPLADAGQEEKPHA